MRLIEQVWFNQHKAKYLIVVLLLPLSLLFFLLSSVRRLAFKLGIKKAQSVSAPVIVVGNIGVGGNGKTPVVVHLVEMIKQMGLTPGVISRGYGGQAPHYPYLLTEQSRADEAGDEPILIYQRCNVPVAVGSNRVENAQLLIKQGCNVIISDDGLQHYRLARDVELIVVDAKRLFGNGLLLPAGPLREGQWRLKRCNCVIYNGEPSHPTHKQHNVTAKPPELLMTLAAKEVCHVQTNTRMPLTEFLLQHKQVNAVAGIGDPQRFFTSLQKIGFTLDAQQGFVDHHRFCLDDFADYPDNKPLLMTEKDAVKCQEFAQAHWWYLPVSAHFNEQDMQSLSDLLREKIL